MRIRTPVLVIAITAAAACEGDDLVAPAGEPPRVRASSAAANPHNVLSAVVTAMLVDADSAAVRYGPATAGLDSITPAVVPVDGAVTLPVLGLHAETTYRMQVVAWGRGAATGQHLTMTTGVLPADMPAFAAEGDDPAPGFVVLAAGSYGLVLDNTGRVVWYRLFPGGAGLNFQAHATGRYTARPPAAPGATARWVELDALGSVLRSLDCAGGLTSRFHDLMVLPDEAYWIMCDETRITDLSASGGIVDARVTATVVQRVGADGTLQFQWNALDHFQLTDLPPAELAGPLVNLTHGNALDLDTDGNLILSFRSLSEVTKISTKTGAVLWRMGGMANQFTFDTPEPPFRSQHGVRVVEPGTLLLLDNLGDPLASRAERYTYDAATRTAQLTHTYASLPPVAALLGGSVQDLSQGRTLVSFGSAGRVEEYDAAGNVMWRLVRPGYVFRAQRIQSLYRPGAGSPR